MVRPGRSYHLHTALLRSKAVAPDFPFLEVPNGKNPLDAPELQAQLGRAVEFRDWSVRPEKERGRHPSPNLERYSTFHQDRSQMKRILQAAASEILWKLQDGALIYVPSATLEGKAMTGELAPRASPRKVLKGTGHRSPISYLGRPLLGAKAFPMRILPSEVTEEARSSGLVTIEFEGYARERLLRAHYGDYQLGAKVAMMEFISENERFDARALARIAAISDTLDHYLTTKEVQHPGLFLFQAEGSSGAEIHARINSKGGRLLVEGHRLAPHLLRALLLIATMTTQVNGQDLESLAANGSILLTNSATSHVPNSDTTKATEHALRDFAREAGVETLDVILENLRRSKDETDGRIDGTSETGR